MNTLAFRGESKKQSVAREKVRNNTVKIGSSIQNITYNL